MKKLLLALIATLTLTLFGTAQTFASANDFTFKSFTGDYYLKTDSENHAHLEIKETLVASFATANQNHGIERCIPRYYRSGGGINLDSITVRQNELPATFSKNTTSDGFVCLRIGNADKYVYGEVKYDISYTYSDVIIKYADANYQELYWDTNGTSWSQPFGTLTARLHLSADAASQMTENAVSCYVGAYKESGSSRCKVSTDTDTTAGDTVITFATENLRAGENLTMNVTFKNDTFAAAVQKKSYIFLIIAVVLTVIFALIIALLLKKRAKQSDKIKLAKDKTVPVQYVPLRGFTVAEMGTNYLKAISGSLNVASLIELATSHKIELEKGEKKTFGGYKWKVHVKDLTDITSEQEIVLKILNGGSNISVGDVIEVKRHTSTATLQLLAKSYNEQIESSLKKKGLREKSKKSKSSAALVIIFVVVCLCFTFPSILIGLVAGTIETATSNPNVIYVGQAPAMVYSVLAFIAFVITAISISASTYKYKQRTIEGIKASKYLDGLKEYMTLAEADRLKFLQSVKGADTTHKGIVKLYERLLPYAVLFKIEDSWMKELNKYYQYDDVSNPDWVTAGVILSASDFRTFNTYASSTISSSTMSSSSGSSSGFSGGGGGGFSGGGGGGGGGGGW